MPLMLPRSGGPTAQVLLILLALYEAPATSEGATPLHARPQQRDSAHAHRVPLAPTAHPARRTTPGTVPARPRNTAPPPLGSPGVWHVSFDTISDHL